MKQVYRLTANEAKTIEESRLGMCNMDSVVVKRTIQGVRCSAIILRSMVREGETIIEVASCHAPDRRHVRQESQV